MLADKYVMAHTRLRLKVVLARPIPTLNDRSWLASVLMSVGHRVRNGKRGTLVRKMNDRKLIYLIELGKRS